MAAKPKKWIQAAHLKKGALHKALGVPEGQKIPKHLLMTAANEKGRVGKMARLAVNMSKFKHKKK